MLTLLKFITENLAFLFGDPNFRFTNSVSTYENGDAMIEFQNADLFIQCIRDRAEISIYIGNNNFRDHFFELSELYQIIKEDTAPNEVTRENLVKFFHNNYDRVRNLLTEEFQLAVEKKI